MRRLAILVATVAMLSIAPAAIAAPPEDRVLIIDVSGDVECDGSSLTFDTTGWVNGKPDTGFFYHLTHVYSNADGESWTYIDTGRVRFFERDGVPYNTLSGRSVNVGPDESSWIGHWVLNMETDEASRAGRGLGYIDELACRMLA
jgi:hypothetical protein